VGRPKIRKRTSGKKRCGLCGKRDRLARTPCCGKWICDDEDEYVLFSYSQNSCSRNHRRYTVCGAHWAEGHADADWRDCEECRNGFAETEMYVWSATNEFNFVKLEDPPAFEPTRCADCGAIIVLSEGGYTHRQGGYSCAKCSPLVGF